VVEVAEVTEAVAEGEEARVEAGVAEWGLKRVMEVGGAVDAEEGEEEEAAAEGEKGH
jgi:hypothetical protein